MTSHDVAQRLENDVNVVRYVGGSHCDIDEDTGEIIILPQAFDRTSKDADGLSFIQRLLLAVDCEADEAEIRRVFATRRVPGRTALFAELNVGVAITALKNQFDSDFYFCEDPLPEDGARIANPAHALLIGLPFKGEAIGSSRAELAGELLCDVIFRTFPAVVA